MATTSYTVAAVAEFAAKPYANLAAAKREADRRAQATGESVQVTTQATGRVSYTAVAEPLVIADQAEVEAVLAAEDRQEALGGVAATLAALVARTAERLEDAPQGPVQPVADEAAEAREAAEFAALVAEVKAETPAPVARAARRTALGDAVVSGWELLYDKPRQAAQVGRKDGQYALLCTKHHHVHPLAKLVDERTARKAGGWCPSC